MATRQSKACGSRVTVRGSPECQTAARRRPRRRAVKRPGAVVCRAASGPESKRGSGRGGVCAGGFLTDLPRPRTSFPSWSTSFSKRAPAQLAVPDPLIPDSVPSR